LPTGNTLLVSQEKSDISSQRLQTSSGKCVQWMRRTTGCDPEKGSSGRMTGIESHRSLSITFEWGYELPRPSTPSLRSSAQDSALRLGSLAQDSSTLFAQLDVGCRDQLFNFEVGTRWGWSPRRRPKAGASDVILRERSESKGGGVHSPTRTWPRHHVVPFPLSAGT